MKTALLIIGIGLMILAPVVLIAGIAWTWLQPRQYEAAVKLLIRDDPKDLDVFPRPTTKAAGQPLSLQTQCELIQSHQMLNKVSDNLDLAKAWGRKLNEDQAPASQSTVLALLANAVHAEPFRDTQMIFIHVRMEDGQEAALVANEIAKVYREFRLREQRTQLERGIQALEGEVAQREKRLSARDQHAQNQEKELATLNLLQTRLGRLRVELEIPGRPVEVLDPAEPSDIPVSPNVFLNIVATLALAVTSFLVGLVTAIMTLSAFRRKLSHPVPGV